MVPYLAELTVYPFPGESASVPLIKRIKLIYKYSKSFLYERNMINDKTWILRPLCFRFPLTYSLQIRANENNVDLLGLQNMAYIK